MLNTASLQAAYILHTRPYRDSSLLIDAFTSSQGRIKLIAKGVRGKNSRFKGLLQAFVPLLITWRGKTELWNLSHAEPNAVVIPQLTGKRLICGLYLNELIMKLLYRHDPHPSLFHAYQIALTRLEQNPNLALRLFEKQLLAELGYALRLSQDSQTQQPILPEQNYQFIPSQGLVFCLNNTTHQASIFSGSSLLAIHHEQWASVNQLLDAKRLFRLALHYLLEGKSIRSRELFLAPT
jgi:DNA repair protein RecO (recombination protein O)